MRIRWRWSWLACALAAVWVSRAAARETTASSAPKGEQQKEAKARILDEPIGVSPCLPPASEALVGFWEQPFPEGSGLLVYEFGADGSTALGAFMLRAGTYELEGRELRRKVKRGSPDPKLEPTTWSLDGDTLVETSADSSTLRKQRVGAADPAGPPVVGTWRFHFEQAKVAWERFRGDGTWEERRPMFLHSGCYAIEGDIVRLSFAGGHISPPARYSIRGDQLTIAPQIPGEEPKRLMRQPEPWELPARTGPPPLPTLPAVEADDLKKPLGSAKVAARPAAASSRSKARPIGALPSPRTG